MTPRDFSQVPVEQLARLLLERARRDPGLPRRTPANSNEAPLGCSAAGSAHPCQPWLAEPRVEQPRFPGQDRIADLVSQALTAAEEAEGIALATREVSHRANLGAAIAMALGTLGAVAGITAGATSLLRGASPARVAAQRVVAAQPAAVFGSRANSAQPPAIQSDPDEALPASLPPLAPATFVRVLPAVPSPSLALPDLPPPRRVSPHAGFGRVLGAVLRQQTG